MLTEGWEYELSGWTCCTPYHSICRSQRCNCCTQGRGEGERSKPKAEHFTLTEKSFFVFHCISTQFLYLQSTEKAVNYSTACAAPFHTFWRIEKLCLVHNLWSPDNVVRESMSWILHYCDAGHIRYTRRDGIMILQITGSRTLGSHGKGAFRLLIKQIKRLTFLVHDVHIHQKLAMMPSTCSWQ